LLLACATRIFAIYLPRSENHHLNLNTLLNKVFEQK